jgi:[CysO sulfur-carrier protein]-S-L-cysteine hydrolase
VVVPAAIRAELRAHAADEAPNECCGLVLLRDGVAVEYIRGVNKLESPYRYELYIDPVVWSEIPDDLEQVVFHSHPETEPRPSRTDRERAGLWSGRPFLIYGLKHDDLRAWTVTREEAVELPLSM